MLSVSQQKRHVSMVLRVVVNLIKCSIVVRNTEAYVLIWGAAYVFEFNKPQLIWSDLADTTDKPAERHKWKSPCKTASRDSIPLL